MAIEISPIEKSSFNRVDFLNTVFGSDATHAPQTAQSIGIGKKSDI